MSVTEQTGNSLSKHNPKGEKGLGEHPQAPPTNQKEIGRIAQRIITWRRSPQRKIFVTTRFAELMRCSLRQGLPKQSPNVERLEARFEGLRKGQVSELGRKKNGSSNTDNPVGRLERVTKPHTVVHPSGYRKTRLRPLGSFRKVNSPGSAARKRKRAVVLG